MANKELENLQNELDNINKAINGINKELKISLSENLIKSVHAAEKLKDAFEAGKNITKSINDELYKSKLAIDINISRASIAGGAAKQKLDIETKILEQIDAQLRKIKAINDESRKQNNVLGFIQNKWTGITKNFGISERIAFVFAAIVDSALSFNKASVDIGKNMGYGAANSDRVARNFLNIARGSENLNVTFKSLVDAMNELSTSTGFVTEYSKDALSTQVMLTKQLGLTGDEAAGFYKYSVLTGKSSEDTYKSVKNSFVALRNQLKVGIPFKATMAEISKISGELAARLGYNPERIAKAVIQAKALGATLEQTKNQADFLLNFEESIEAELKAELLTGKALNFEKARALALQNDLAGVAQELANQGMTAAKFGQMNAISQKSYAASLGLGTDALSEQLQKRELALASGKSLAQIDSEQADQAAKRQDVQTKFNAAVEKLKDLIGGIVAGPLGMVLDIFSDILGVVGKLVASIQNLFGSTVAKTLIGALTGFAVGGPGGALIGGLAGLASGMMGDDVVSPGYGKRMILGPEGAVSLNNKDSIVAGTNLGGGNSGVIAAIANLTSTFKESANRPAVAYIQGERPFANNLGRHSQLFTSGMQNQSKLA